MTITAPLLAVPEPHAYRLADLPPVIAANITTDVVTGEWIWTGRTDRDGYGRIGGQMAHRVVYATVGGLILPGLELDHVRSRGCTSRACVSPWHLEPVTHRVNTLRGDSFAAVNARKVQCAHGHRYDDANTYRWNGRRDCRICIRARVRRYKRRQRQALLGRFELGHAA